jgi:hypothetical protein
VIRDALEFRDLTPEEVGVTRCEYDFETCAEQATRFYAGHPLCERHRVKMRGLLFGYAYGLGAKKIKESLKL